MDRFEITKAIEKKMLDIVSAIPDTQSSASEGHCMAGTVVQLNRVLRSLPKLGVEERDALRAKSKAACDRLMARH